jgi:hypothetical protein
VRDGIHPSDLVRGKGLSPSTRATGTLPVIVQSPECCWTNFCLGTNFFRKRFEDHALMRAIDGSLTICAWPWQKNRRRLSETTRRNARDMRA